MRIGILILIAVGVGIVAGSAVGQPQPKDGDLVLPLGAVSTLQSSWVGYFDPAKPSSITTLAITPPGYVSSWVRMASDNAALVVNEVDLTSWASTPQLPYLIRLAPSGSRSTIAGEGWYQLPSVPSSFELDHDGQWVVTGNTWFGMWCTQMIFGAAQSQASNIFGNLKPAMLQSLAGFTIDRDPGCALYCVISDQSGGSIPAPGSTLLCMDRQGTVVTLVTSMADPYSIQLHPRTGDYLVSYCVGIGGCFPAIAAISKTGRITTLNSKVAGVATRVTQDDHLWLIDQSSTFGRLLKFHIPTKTVALSVPTAGWSLWPPPALKGLEVYGYRRLVCYQPPSAPTTVTINVQSRHPLAAGKSYILAASFSRRPGMKFANGEWLDLDTTHPLFWLTAQNSAPSMFVNFRGVLDSKGNNTNPIQVNVPPGLPKLNDMAIFVAGVIYDPKNKNQVIQVTNSHWFVLN